jgi:hypothetical protein
LVPAVPEQPTGQSWPVHASGSDVLETDESSAGM